MTLTFVETLLFTARWDRRLADEDLRRLQNWLMEDPLRGDPIPGCGLLRKIRFADRSRGLGKRGGVRVLYVFTPEASRIDLVTVYGKDEKDNLSARELREFCAAARVLRREAVALTHLTRARPRRKQ
jgi:mRNA-degrading endonuclease RelE of RelBE toxin-antitoxin system